MPSAHEVLRFSERPKKIMPRLFGSRVAAGAHLGDAPHDFCKSRSLPQPVFLADFKQIKKVQCLSQSDGKALINLHVEGARQVRTGAGK